MPRASVPAPQGAQRPVRVWRRWPQNGSQNIFFHKSIMVTHDCKRFPPVQGGHLPRNMGLLGPGGTLFLFLAQIGRWEGASRAKPPVSFRTGATEKISATPKRRFRIQPFRSVDDNMRRVHLCPMSTRALTPTACRIYQISAHRIHHDQQRKHDQ